MLLFRWRNQIRSFDIDNILIDEKSHENYLIYDFLYETFIGAKSLRIGFNKIDGFIRIYDGARYLLWFGSEKYDAIYKRIRYLISLYSSLEYVFSRYYVKIKVDSHDFLPKE